MEDFYQGVRQDFLVQKVGLEDEDGFVEGVGENLCLAVAYGMPETLVQIDNDKEIPLGSKEIVETLQSEADYIEEQIGGYVSIEGETIYSQWNSELSMLNEARKRIQDHIGVAERSIQKAAEEARILTMAEDMPFSFVEVESLKELFVAYRTDALKAFNAKLHLPAVILMTSIAEGLLSYAAGANVSSRNYGRYFPETLATSFLPSDPLSSSR